MDVAFARNFSAIRPRHDLISSVKQRAERLLDVRDSGKAAKRLMLAVRAIIIALITIVLVAVMVAGAEPKQRLADQENEGY